MNHYHRYPGELKVSDPGQFTTSGLRRWCALCGGPRPSLGGTIRRILGARQFVCGLHPKAPKK